MNDMGKNLPSELSQGPHEIMLKLYAKALPHVS